MSPAIRSPRHTNVSIAINAERSRVLPLIESKENPLPNAAARRAELGY